MKNWTRNALLATLVAIALAMASTAVLALMFVGSAFRMSNITQLDVLSPANLEAAMPLFLVSAAIVFFGVLFSAFYALRSKG